MFEFLGLALVLLSWVGGFYLVRTWRGTQAMSISQHAASARGASKLFFVVLVLGGGAFYAWLISWFAPHIHLSFLFTVILTATIVLQTVAALIPDSGTWKSKVHRPAAYTMAFLYFPLSYLILSSPAITNEARIVGATSLGYMVFASLLFFIVKRARDRYLTFQALYIVAFQLIILSAAYL